MLSRIKKFFLSLFSSNTLDFRCQIDGLDIRVKVVNDKIIEKPSDWTDEQTWEFVKVKMDELDQSIKELDEAIKELDGMFR